MVSSIRRRRSDGSGGCPGDRLFVSGCLGDAGLALQRTREPVASSPVDDGLQERLDRQCREWPSGCCWRDGHRPQSISRMAWSADLGHICTASRVGARIELGRLPVSPAVAAECGLGNWQPVLAGGDDYELLFTVEPARVDDLLGLCSEAGQPVQEIGCLVADSGISLVYPDGRESKEIPRGFDHFRT